MKWSILKWLANAKVRAAFVILLTLPFLVSFLQSMAGYLGTANDAASRWSNVFGALDASISRIAIRYQLCVIGAIVYLLTSLIVNGIAPELLKHHQTAMAYGTWCAENCDTLNSHAEFSLLTALSDAEAKARFPQHATLIPMEYARAFAPKAMWFRCYGQMSFDIYNASARRIRWVLTVLLLASVALMFWPTLWRLLVVLGVPL